MLFYPKIWRFNFLIQAHQRVYKINCFRGLIYIGCTTRQSSKSITEHNAAWLGEGLLKFIQSSIVQHLTDTQPLNQYRQSLLHILSDLTQVIQNCYNTNAIDRNLISAILFTTLLLSVVLSSNFELISLCVPIFNHCRNHIDAIASFIVLALKLSWPCNQVCLDDESFVYANLSYDFHSPHSGHISILIQLFEPEDMSWIEYSKLSMHSY